jgi:hypothetical protein
MLPAKDSRTNSHDYAGNATNSRSPSIPHNPLLSQRMALAHVKSSSCTPGQAWVPSRTFRRHTRQACEWGGGDVLSVQ